MPELPGWALPVGIGIGSLLMGPAIAGVAGGAMGAGGAGLGAGYAGGLGSLFGTKALMGAGLMSTALTGMMGGNNQRLDGSKPDKGAKIDTRTYEEDYQAAPEGYRAGIDPEHDYFRRRQTGGQERGRYFAGGLVRSTDTWQRPATPPMAFPQNVRRPTPSYGMQPRPPVGGGAPIPTPPAGGGGGTPTPTPAPAPVVRNPSTGPLLPQSNVNMANRDSFMDGQMQTRIAERDGGGYAFGGLVRPAGAFATKFAGQNPGQAFGQWRSGLMQNQHAAQASPQGGAMPDFNSIVQGGVQGLMGRVGEMAQGAFGNINNVMDQAKTQFQGGIANVQSGVNSAMSNSPGMAQSAAHWTGRQGFAEGGVASLSPKQASPDDAALIEETAMALMGQAPQEVIGQFVKEFGEKALADLAERVKVLMAQGGMEAGGQSHGLNDKIPANLSEGEYVIPADAVSHLGNGSTDAGAQQLDGMVEKVRDMRGANKPKPIDPNKAMPI